MNFFSNWWNTPLSHNTVSYNSWKLKHFVLLWQAFLYIQRLTRSHKCDSPVSADLHWFIWTKFKLWSIIFWLKFLSRHMSRRYLWSTISFIGMNTINNSLQILDTANRSNQDCQQCYHSTRYTAQRSIQRIQYFSSRTSRYFIAKYLFYHIITGLPSPIPLIVWRASVLNQRGNLKRGQF